MHQVPHHPAPTTLDEWMHQSPAHFTHLTLAIWLSHTHPPPWPNECARCPTTPHPPPLMNRCTSCPPTSLSPSGPLTHTHHLGWTSTTPHFPPFDLTHSLGWLCTSLTFNSCPPPNAPGTAKHKQRLKMKCWIILIDNSIFHFTYIFTCSYKSPLILRYMFITITVPCHSPFHLPCPYSLILGFQIYFQIYFDFSVDFWFFLLFSTFLCWRYLSETCPFTHHLINCFLLFGIILLYSDIFYIWILNIFGTQKLSDISSSFTWSWYVSTLELFIFFSLYLITC